MRCPKCLQLFPTGTVLCPNDNTPLNVENLANTTPSSETLITPDKTLAGSGFGAGTKMGEYVLEDKIGEGGMGQVWKGRHPHIGKRVAIKILSERLARDHKTLARFMNEAKAVNEIQHRNIVDIFAFGELADGRPYFVMELLRGDSLAQYIKNKGPLPFSEILTITEQTCRALQAAHDGGIIHRDLKPDNIFLVMEGGAPPFVKVLDFGIAKLSGELGPDGHRLTATGTVMGTATYMSPEQAEGREIDHRADIYALGIILFEMLTGRTPFYEPGDGVGSIISKHIYLPSPPPSTMVAGRSLPPELDAFVLKLLAKKPEERLNSCSQIYPELVKAIGEQKTEGALQSAKPLYGNAPTQNMVSEQIIKLTPQPVAPQDTAGISREIAPEKKSKVAAFIKFAALFAAILFVVNFVTNKKNRDRDRDNAKRPELAKQDVLAKLTSLQADFQSCYDRAAEKNPELPNQTSFQIEISPNGDVITAKPIASISPAVDNCISTQIATLTFSVSSGGAKMTHPLNFTPKVVQLTPSVIVEPKADTVSLFVSCDQADAEIFINGEKRGISLANKASTIELQKGEQMVDVTLKKVGFEDEMQPFQPIANGALPFKLTPVAAPTPTIIKKNQLPKTTPEPTPNTNQPSTNKALNKTTTISIETKKP